MQGVIQFGGFYESEHYYNVECMLDTYFDDNDYSHINIDYEAIYNEYGKMWLELFNFWMISEYGVNLKIKFISINSPREYNYTTDNIEVEYNSKNLKKLINDEVIEYINNNSKSYDGFLSFYEGYNEVKKDKEILFDYVMQYYANEYNNEYFTDDYDLNCGYELLNGLDFIKEKDKK